MKEDTFTSLAIQFLSGELTKEECTKFKLSVTESPENQVLFSEIEKLWKNTGPQEPQIIPDKAPVWQAIESRLKNQKRSTSEKTALPSFWRRGGKVSIIAAAAIFILAVGMITFMRDSTPSAQTFITMKAERLSIPLPDGSTAILNSGSRLTWVSTSTGNVRQVLLTGQAYFDVVSNGQPFMVQTENAQVRVLGTQFDIYARNHATRVIVKEGQVSVQSVSNSDQPAVILNPNEMTQCLGDQPPDQPQSIDAVQAIGWLDRKLVFVKTPVSEIVAELHRVYNIQIHVSDPDIEQLTITGTFDQQDAASIINDLCISLDLKLSINNEIYTISR